MSLQSVLQPTYLRGKRASSAVISKPLKSCKKNCENEYGNYRPLPNNNNHVPSIDMSKTIPRNRGKKVMKERDAVMQYLSLIANVKEILKELEEISVNSLSNYTFKTCERLLFESREYFAKIDELFLKDYADSTSKLKHLCESTVESLLLEHCKLGLGVENFGHDAYYAFIPNSNCNYPLKKDSTLQDQIQTINQIILNLESLPGSAIKALEVSELKNLICHLNEKAIKLDELCESSSEWTNLKQFLNDAIVLLAKFERHSVFENINYEATEPAIKAVSEKTRLKSTEIILQECCTVRSDTSNINAFNSLSTVLRKPKTFFPKAARFKESKNSSGNFLALNPSFCYIKPNLQTYLIKDDVRKKSLVKIPSKKISISKPSESCVPPNKISVITVHKPVLSLPGPGFYYNVRPPNVICKLRIFSPVIRMKPSNFSPLIKYNEIPLHHPKKLSNPANNEALHVQLKKVREKRRLRRAIETIEKETPLKANLPPVWKEISSNTDAIKFRRSEELHPNYDYFKSNKPVGIIKESKMSKRKTLYWWKLRGGNSKLLHQSEIMDNIGTSFKNTGLKKQVFDYRFYPLPISTDNKHTKSKKQPFGSFSDDDAEFLEERLKLDPTLLTDKVYGVGFGQGYRKKLASNGNNSENLGSENKEVTMMDNNTRFFKVGFGTGRDSFAIEQDDCLYLDNKEKRGNNGFLFRDYTQEDNEMSDNENTLLLSVNDDLLRTRHPAYLFAKPKLLERKHVEVSSPSAVPSYANIPGTIKFGKSDWQKRTGRTDVSLEDDDLCVRFDMNPEKSKGGQFGNSFNGSELDSPVEFLEVGVNSRGSGIGNLTFANQISRSKLKNEGVDTFLKYNPQHVEEKLLPRWESQVGRVDTLENDEVVTDINADPLSLMSKAPSVRFDLQPRFDNEIIEEDKIGDHFVLNTEKSINFLRKHVPIAVFAAKPFKPFIPSPVAAIPSPRPMEPPRKPILKKDMRSNRQLEAEQILEEELGLNSKTSAFGELKNTGRTIIKTKNNGSNVVVGGTASLLKFVGNKNPSSKPTALITSLSNKLQGLSINSTSVDTVLAQNSLTTQMRNSLDDGV